MRVCSQCGAEVQEDAIFCISCGTKQPPVNMAENQNPMPKQESLDSYPDPLPEVESDNIQKDTTDTTIKKPAINTTVKIEKKATLKTTEKKQKNNDQTGVPSFIGSDALLYLALLSISVLPGVVESLIMLMTKHSMSQLVVLFIELAGMVVGLILLSQYLSTFNNGNKTRERLLMAGAGILWMYVISTLTLRLLEVLESFAFSNFIQFYWIYYILFLVIIFGALVAMSRILSRTVNRLTVGHPGKLMRRPKLFWKTLLLLGAALFFVPDLMVIIFSGVFISLPLSFVGTVTEWVATIYVQAVLLKFTVDGIVQAADAKDIVSEETTNQKLNKIMPLVAAGLVVALLVYDLIGSALVSTLDSIEVNIQNDMSLGAYYMAAGDIEMALEMYDTAYEKTNGWLAFVSDEPNQLRQLYNENPDNEQVEYLMAMKSYTIAEMEKAILEDKSSSDWYHLLLEAYKAQETNEENPIPLTEEQEIFRKEILNACIAGQSLINSNITLKEVEGKEKKITKALNPYLEFIEQYGVYKILNEVSLNGGMNSGIMNQLLTYAEENRNDLLAQYMAYGAGRNFLYDGAPHYQRTAEAAMRFRDLYLEQLDKDSDVEALTIAINMEVADVLMDLQDYANAVTYLEEAADLGAEGSTRLMAARGYDALENYDKALEMAAIVIRENKDDYEALNVAMISALKVGKVTESMGYAASLLKRMPSLDGIEYLMVDADMYIYAQYMTVSDQTQWTPQMKYQVYPDLDEDQLKILEENPLLDHYIKALYFTFGGRDFEQAWAHTEELIKVMPESAQIQYLAGTIHFNKREFESAVGYYTASLEIDDTAPSVWYALANAYDAMGDYQQAYNCTLEVAELLKYNNHAVDIYGVQPHNERLMSSLASKIEQGGN